ncbi:Late embryogenesis abundant protein, LEA-14 [Artemisia annua]|uniref:Late embryogenesis abundant protein, LEA-14 n=1 Tax=Artemisia annua TaxID=35608 RepID=A0A2U1N0J1_ARTAN|nr:Late embryogenesis abundant protein, LEA-14 [Artemisia annua]
MEAKKVKSRKILKICCGFVALLMIILLVSIILLLTVFKLKHPKVTTHPTHLENVEFQLLPNISINATIVLNVTITNRNHGSFKFRDSIAYVDYRGTLIVEIPIEHAKIPARGNYTITAYANVTAEKMVTNPNFYNDIESGHLNFTSTATLKGEVSLFNIIKMRAKVTNGCDIFVEISTRKVESECHAKFKI